MANNIYIVNSLGSSSGVVINDDGTGIDEIRITGTYSQRPSIRLDWTTSPSPSAHGRFFPNPTPDNTSISLTINGIIENARGSNGGDDIQGNQFANVIYGDAARTGPGGNDVISAGDGNDTVYGGTGNDSVGGGAGNDRLYGDDGADTINGDSGIDTIEGGAGADVLFGGSDAGDTVSYASSNAAVTINITHGTQTTGVGGHAQGDKIKGFSDVTGSAFADIITDTVKGTIAFGYNDNKFSGGGGNDRLYLGGGDDAGYGGDGNDAVYGEVGNDLLDGGAGHDLLDGGGGNDTMYGGTGNDIYIVSSTGDRVIEAVGAGTDTVRSYIDWTLGANVERLEFVGTASVSGNGNSLNNTIIGNSGSNTLRGGAGNDLLVGGAGKDTLVGGTGSDAFLFNAPLGSTNIDKITDYSAASDTIQLENSIFTGLPAGWLTAGAFRIGPTAQDSTDRIMYDPMSGFLRFDKDGLGGAAPVQFATLTPGLVLSAGEFFIV
ncbi:MULTISPECIES: calcium-binding protein [unclassified Mesorhizobium]|uniref:calcium-binding protein n=1 Tax=unclassified Mesorhizobium TaxID=325217 RepID=UPI00301420EC